jgi:glycosyltransferase involved in cell wall biosynthesis
VGTTLPDEFPDAWARHDLPQEALLLLHEDFRPQVLDLLGELMLQPPELLHCWLDYTNVAGLVAAQLGGVPRTLLSLRAVSPEQCPRLLSPWLHAWYQVGMELPGVKVVANSTAGARDYERWLGLPAEQIRVIHNAFVPPAAPGAQEVVEFRRRHGLKTSTPVVAGVFRLDSEKRPLLFLSIVNQVRQQVPDLQVLMAGCGSLEEDVKKEIKRLDLENVVHLLGLRRDVPVILSSSQVLLLVSNVEGTPNVALEAQHFGCVPVLTDAGGSGEAIVPGATGLLYGMDDHAGLVQGVVRLLRDGLLRSELADAGRAFVAQRFDPNMIHAHTLALYEEMGLDTDRALRRVA